MRPAVGFKSLKEGVAAFDLKQRPFLAKALLRFQLSQSSAVCREASLHSLEPGEAGIVEARRRLGAEQLSPSRQLAASEELKSSPNGLRASASG